MAGPSFDDYWQFRMDGATARLRAAQQIVSHPGTRGTLAENLLRELIREFLPQRWGAGTGFVMSVEEGRSNQVDLLIYDQLTTSPIYRDGDLVILSPGTARVAVEVKSGLDKTQIPLAYENICSVKQVDPDLVGFIFGYNGVQSDTFVKHVQAWAGRQETPDRAHWPDRVYNMGQEFTAYADTETVSKSGRLLTDSQFVVKGAADPVVRSFLTAVLQHLGLDNLRPFMRADRIGETLTTF